jgi:protein-disulfide isomerase
MFEKLVTFILTLAALAIAATYVHREFKIRTGPVRPNPNVPVFQSGWERAFEVGRTVGDSAARVHIVEFSDLECPFCAEAYARFHSDTSSIARRYKSSVSYTFVHFPLSMHRFARPAARGAECARAAGRFFPFVQAVFARQDSIGLRPWSAYARDAGVSDILTFEKCAGDATTVSSIDDGFALGRSFQVASTPTILINGWKFTGLLDDSAYTGTIDALLMGRKPPGAP